MFEVKDLVDQLVINLVRLDSLRREVFPTFNKRQRCRREMQAHQLSRTCDTLADQPLVR